MRLLVCAVFCIVAIPAAAEGLITEPVNRSFPGTGLGGTSPGTPFTLDYRAGILTGAPYDLHEFDFLFNGELTQFSELNIQLDSSPTVFVFDPITPVPTEVQYFLYDPAITTPPPGTVLDYVPLPQAWRDEAADGIISGHLWLTNPTGGSGSYLLTTNTLFAIPEPSAGMLIGAGVLGILRRHRRKT